MNKHILSIDDDEGVRKSFILSLKDTEYQVDTAESGEKGIEMEKKRRYDLIFLDLKMPGINGAETLRELRKIDKDVPVYIVTAYFEEFFKELESVRDQGIDFDVIRKPFSREEIVLVAESTLEGPEVY